MKEQETSRLQITLPLTDLAAADTVAFAYGMTLPDLVRALLVYAREERPDLTVKARGRRKPGRPAKRYATSGRQHNEMPSHA